MAESSVQAPAGRVEGSAGPPIIDRTPSRVTDAAGEASIDMHDGPDYVDDWMEKNVSISLREFVRSHCTSFARWDLLRELHSCRRVTLESLVKSIGVGEATILSELKILEASGLVIRRNGQGSASYGLASDSGLEENLQAAVQAYEEDREFRFALVYIIVRASHSGAVVE